MAAVNMFFYTARIDRAKDGESAVRQVRRLSYRTKRTRYYIRKSPSRHKHLEIELEQPERAHSGSTFILIVQRVLKHWSSATYSSQVKTMTP